MPRALPRCWNWRTRWPRADRCKRSVLFVCYGSEELGDLGSTYFGMHPPVPLKDLVANLEFEMIGTQDPKMPPGVLLLTGWDRSNLGPALKEHGALLGPDPYPEQHFFERSDNYALALDGVVAHTAAGMGYAAHISPAERRPGAPGCGVHDAGDSVAD